MLTLSEDALDYNSFNDLERFWLDELHLAPNLSHRLTVLLALRNNLPKKCFESLMRNAKFVRWLKAFESQMRKWDIAGRPPDEETLVAFIGLTAGMPCERVFDLVIEEVMSRPTRYKMPIEKRRELFLRKQAVSKKIYRVKKSLEASGFSVRHRPYISQEIADFIERLKLAEAKFFSNAMPNS